MAPKRTAAAKAPPAKKVKVTTPEAPILDFVGKYDDLPKACRELLQTALPICFEATESDRHAFEAEILGKVETLIAGVEKTKRETLREAEAVLAGLNTEKDKASADLSEKKAAADAKDSECKEKEKVVDAARDVHKAAAKAHKDAEKEEANFNKKKSGLLAEQEGFAKLMNDGFESLKANTFKGDGRKKGKLIAELQSKLSELGAQESLAEALSTTLKMTAEKREGAFAKATLDFAKEIFDKHTAKVAADIAALDSEEAACKAAVAKEEATAAEKKAALDAVTAEWDAMQDVWADLDKTRAEAAKAEKQVESGMPRAQKAIDKATADLNKFLEVPTLFASLKEKSSVAANGEEEKAEEAAEGSGENADETMQA